MSDAKRRALRTVLQVSLVQALMALYDAFSPVDLTIEQMTAITLVVTPLIAFAQNWLEDNTTAPAILKENPKPDPRA